MQLGGESPIVVVVSPSNSFEKLVLVSSDSPPHITIHSESMQVDSNKVIVDKSEDPFKDFGLAIVGNIVDYSSSTNEDQVEKEKKKEDTFDEKRFGDVSASTEATTTSVPIATVIVRPSTLPT